MHNYVRLVPQETNVGIQVVVPKNFMSTKKLRDIFPKYMERVAEEAMEFWETRAAQKLNTSFDRYVEGIDSFVTDRGSVVLRLDGRFPVKVETGSSSYDMKPGFAASPLLKTSKTRKTQYMVIPMNINGVKVFRTFSTSMLGGKAWIHPGFKGVNIAEDVKQQLKEFILPEAMADMLDEAFS